MIQESFEYCDDRISMKLWDGIIHVVWHVEYADYNFVNDNIKKGIELSENKSYPMLTDISELKGVSKDAQHRLSEEDSLIGVNALAVLYKSRLQKVLFTIYGIINKPKIPVKLFKNKEKAIKWLQQFK